MLHAAPLVDAIFGCLRGGIPNVHVEASRGRWQNVSLLS